MTRLLTRRQAEAAAVYPVEGAVREALAGDSAHAARLADNLGRA